MDEIVFPLKTVIKYLRSAADLSETSRASEHTSFEITLREHLKIEKISALGSQLIFSLSRKYFPVTFYYH